MLRALALATLVCACGSPTAKKAGQSCTSSSECDKGLLCDTAQHVCAGMGSVDAAVNVDGALVDGRPIDARPIDAPVDAPPDAPPD